MYIQSHSSWIHSPCTPHPHHNFHVFDTLFAIRAFNPRPPFNEEFRRKMGYIHFVNLRYSRLKLLKYKENNTNKNYVLLFIITANIYLHIYNELGIIRKAFFLLYHWALTLKFQKWRLTRFAMKFFKYTNFRGVFFLADAVHATMEVTPRCGIVLLSRL